MSGGVFFGVRLWLLSAAMMGFAFMNSCMAIQDSIADDTVTSPVATIPETSTTSETLATKSGLVAEVVQSAGRRIAVIICGHPGDSEHLELFQGSVDRICAGLETNYQFLSDDIHVFMGDEVEEAGAVATETKSSFTSTAAASATPATKANIEARLQNLKGPIKPDDSLFVVVIGHTHFENNLAWLNIHGPDLQQKDFAVLFDGFAASEQTFFVTTPCSGYYIRPLSRPGRVIITATESDLEVNETLCPHVLAEMLSSAPLPEWDLDADSQLSLFEFYISLCRGVADRYLNETLIATEHAQLDDNADGKGSELQLHYLTEDQGGLPPNRQRQKLTEGRDGIAASLRRLTSVQAAAAN